MGDPTGPVTASGRRSYGLALVLLLAGAVVLATAYGLTWAVARVPLVAGAEGAVREASLTGRDLLPLAGAAGWVCLAGVAGIVATRAWGRALVAATVLIAAVGGALAAAAFAAAPTDLVVDGVSRLAGAGDPAEFTTTAAWLAALVGGAATAAAAAWTVVAGRRWPTLGARYERVPRSDRTLSAWEALDAGQDPTDDLVE